MPLTYFLLNALFFQRFYFLLGRASFTLSSLLFPSLFSLLLFFFFCFNFSFSFSFSSTEFKLKKKGGKTRPPFLLNQTTVILQIAVTDSAVAVHPLTHTATTTTCIVLEHASIVALSF